MKNKKLWVAVIALIAAISLLAGCQKSEPLVIKDSETCIVLRVTEEVLDGKTDMVLIDYMNQLSDEGKLTCTISNGMVTSINGKDNAADYSSCWMLYTSDADNSNAAWGTVEYDGKEYGSAISGAEELVIKPGQLYIWVFQSF